MARASYGEIVSRHIARIVRERGIDDVLHFSRIENLGAILRHGIRSRSELKDADFDAYPSDPDRLDGEDGAVSVSVSCFYPAMFEAKRHRAGRGRWAILVLDPSLLWERRCLFFRHSAITNDTKHENGRRNGGYALERLFADCSLSRDDRGTGFRAAHGLWPDRPDFTTFPDSEVRVMDPIDPGYVRGVWVETDSDAGLVESVLREAGREDCRLLVKSFEPRVVSGFLRWG